MAKSNIAGELVPRGRVGTGAAQILTGPQSDPLGRYYRAKGAGIDPKAVAADRAVKMKSFNTVMDWSPDKGWDVQNFPIVEKANALRKEIQQAFNSGTQIDAAAIKQKQDVINMEAAYSQSNKEGYLKSIALMRANGFYNEGRFMDDINEPLWQYDAKGNLAPTPAFSHTKDTWTNPLLNSKNFETNKLWREVLGSFDKITGEYINENSNEDFTRKDRQTIEGALLTWENGILQTDENGFPIINIDINDKNDLAKKVMMGNPMIRQIVEEGRAANIPESEIWEEPMEMLRAQVGIKGTKIREEKKGKPGADFDMEDIAADHVVRKHNIVDKNGETKQVDVNVVEYIPWKAGMDRTIPVQSGIAFNIGTGKVEEGWAGNRNMEITALQYVPWNNDPRGQKEPQIEYTPEGEKVEPAGPVEPAGAALRHPQKGHIVYLSQEEYSRKQLSDKYYGGRRMALAEYTDENEVHQLLIPYDQVQGKLRAKTGFDWEKIPLYQRSETEIIDYVKSIAPSLTEDQIIEKAQGIIENKIP